MLGVSIAGYLRLTAGQPALDLVAALPAGSSGWPRAPVFAVREAAVPRPD